MRSDPMSSLGRTVLGIKCSIYPEFNAYSSVSGKALKNRRSGQQTIVSKAENGGLFPSTRSRKLLSLLSLQYFQL